MLQALIVGLVWLTGTAAVSVVIGRALRRADARQERDARDQRQDRLPAPTGAARPVGRGPALPPASRGTVQHPSGHGLPPSARRPGRRRR
ncbi:hypothetical protein [Modestobacter sp. NPDC049651]|uniref:hypothetical protein n=1 Tax=unclassified Modestobacter TaxID=2643866 RepID=UPI0033FD8670